MRREKEQRDLLGLKYVVQIDELDKRQLDVVNEHPKVVLGSWKTCSTCIFDGEPLAMSLTTE